ncbi:MAG: acetate--CoA ligase family protein [Candidatus Sulfobium sp.]|jgi:acyl-CoA synthetase (NDP forming)
MAAETVNSQHARNDPFSNILKKFAAGKTDRSLPEREVKKLLKETGLSIPRGVFIPRGKTTLCHELRYPLVAKVSSSTISSKSDVGGVVVGINDQKSLEKTVARLMKIESAEGVLIEEMAPPGVEVIVGGTIDMQFGPVVMFGLGGIFVELFRDVAFGLAPMNEEDAMRLAKQVKGYKLLEGYRGKQPVDINGLLKIMVTVSKLMATGLIEEMDLNPVALYPEGTMILDAKMSLRAAD